jgi:hypothetical protein
MRCQSASACVVCSARIAKGRGEWLSAVFNRAKQNGENISMITLTVRHKKGNDLKHLFEAMEQAYRNVQGTQAYKDLRRKFNAKFVRVTEVTHGRNGYHPHFHIAVIHDPTIVISTLKKEIQDTWCRWIENNGLLAPEPEIAVDIVDNATNEQRAWYLTKSNGLSSLEVTNGKYKVAKGENMSIWGIHALAVSGDSKSGQIWREYEQAMYKKRIFVVSRGMQEEYGLYMKSDADLSKDEFVLDVPEIADNLHYLEADDQPMLVFVGAINKETWRKIKQLKLQSEFREAIRNDLLDEFLDEYHLQRSYKYDDIRIRHELKAEILAGMHAAMDNYEPAEFDKLNQAYDLGELLPLLDKTLNGAF